MANNPSKITQVGTFGQSMSLLDSSIFETSHAEKLVQYIRQKRGINNGKRIFNDSPVKEVVERSFPIEIQPTQEKLIQKSPLKPSAKEDKHLETCSNSRIPRVILHRVNLQRENIGRRILLQEFQKASGGEESFQPAAFSTPISEVINGDPNMSVISKITPICREEEIAEIQEPNEALKPANNVDDYFQKITKDKDKVILVAGIHSLVDPPVIVHQQEQTHKNNNQADEENDSATLINNGGGRKEGCGLNVLNEVQKSSIGNNLSHASQNKEKSLKGKSSSLRFKRIKSSNRPTLFPGISLNDDEGPVFEKDVCELPSNSNTCEPASDFNKENQNCNTKNTDQSSFNIKRNSRRSRVKSQNFIAFSQVSPSTKHIKQTGQHIALGNSSNSDSSSEFDDENAVLEEEFNTYFNINLNSKKSKFKSADSPTRSVQRIMSDWSNVSSKEDCENCKKNHDPRRIRGHMSSRIDPSSRRREVRPRNRLLRKVPIFTKETEDDQRIAVKDLLDSKHNFPNEKEIPKSTGHTSSRIEQSPKDRVVLKDKCDEHLVYIPIIQNIHKKTERENRCDKENIANDCTIRTNKFLITKDVECQKEISGLITSDEEGEHITDTTLTRGKHNVKTGNEKQFLRQNNNPIDLRTRKSNQENKILGGQKEISNANQRFEKYHLRTTSEVHPSDQPIDKIILPLENGLIQRRKSVTNCDIYTDEEVTNNTCLQYSTKAVKEHRNEKSRTDSCSAENGTLHFSLESSNVNTMEDVNCKILPVNLMQKNDITVSNVLKTQNQQTIPVGRKCKTRLSQQMDPIKRDYLDISKTFKKTALEKINVSRRKLYSKGDSDNDSQLPDTSEKLSQKTLVISHSKEGTRKTLEFSENVRNEVSNKNAQCVQSIDSYDGDLNNERKFPEFTFTSETENKNDIVFKKPSKPVSKGTKRRNRKKPNQKNVKDNSNNALHKLNPAISTEEQHQSRCRYEETNIPKESTYNECNSLDLPVEPDVVEHHLEEQIAISRTKKRRLSNIIENMKSMVRITDETKVSNAISKENEKEKDSHSSLVNSRSKPMTSSHLPSEELNNGLRRSTRQRKSPIVYWSCRLQVSKTSEELKDMPVENKKKKIKALPPVKEKKTKYNLSSKTKGGSATSKKELKGDKNKKNSEKLKYIVSQNNDTCKYAVDNIATNESHLACELSGHLEKSFSSEQSKRHKDLKTNEENVMNKIAKFSEKSSTESNERFPKVGNQQGAASSSDEISTCQENQINCRSAPSTDFGTQTNTNGIHVKRKDRSFVWFKNLSSSQTSTSNKNIVQIVHSNTKIANSEDMVVEEINGVKYAFYTAENHYGYMKFHPHSVKPSARTKTFDLKFLLLVGKSLQLEIEETTFIIKNGDLVTVPKGVRYGLSNTTDDEVILFFIRIAK